MGEVYISGRLSSNDPSIPEAPVATVTAGAPPSPDIDLDALFQQAGQQNNVDPDLLRAQMQVESGGDPNAVSPQGAQGLMQLLPATAQALGVTNPNDPRQAIPAAARLMAQNLQATGGNVPQAVAMYHGGTNPANWGPKTQAYVQKVGQTFQGIKSLPQPTDPVMAALLGKPVQVPAQSAPVAPVPTPAPPAPAPPAPTSSPQIDTSDPVMAALMGVPAANAAPATNPPPSAMQAQPVGMPAPGPQMGNPQAMKPQPVPSGHTLPKIGFGMMEGLHDITDVPAAWLGKQFPGIDQSGFMGMPSASQANANWQNDVAASPYKNSDVTKAARIGTDIVETLPAGELKAGTWAAPVLTKIPLAGKFLPGTLNLGGQGAVTGTVLAGAEPNQSLAADAAWGAGGGIVGGALAGAATRLVGPTVARAGSYLGQKIKPYSDMLADALGRTGSAAEHVEPTMGDATAAVGTANTDAAHDELAAALAKNHVDIDTDLSPDERSKLMADMLDAQDKGIPFDPMARMRERDFATVGFTGDTAPTPAQISRDPNLWKNEQNLAKTDEGGAISQRYADQKQQLARFAEGLRDNTGGTAASPSQAGQATQAAVSAKWHEMQAQVGRAYDAVRDEVGDNAGMKPDALYTTMNEASLDAAADPLLTGVNRILKRYGVVNEDGSYNAQRELTVTQAEELRKRINGLSDGNDPAVQRLKGQLVDAIDHDVQQTTGSDAFAAARTQAKERFQQFFPKVADQYNATVPGRIINGKIAPEDILDRLFYNGKAADVAQVKKILLTGTPEQIQRGNAAWNDMRGQLVDSMLSKAFNPDTGEWRPAQFSKALDSVGMSTLKEAFSDKELAALGAIKRAGAAAISQPANAAVNNSNSATTMVDALTRPDSKLAQKLGIARGVLHTVGVGMHHIHPGAAAAIHGVGMAAGVAGEAFGSTATKGTVKDILSGQGLDAFNAAMVRRVKDANVRAALAALPYGQVTGAMMANARSAGKGGENDAR